MNYSSSTLPVIAGHSIAFNLPAILIVAAVTSLLVYGIRESAGANTMIVIIKTAVVVFVIAFGAFMVNPPNWHPYVPNGFTGVMSGAAIVFFAFIGASSTSRLTRQNRYALLSTPHFRGVAQTFVVVGVLVIVFLGVRAGFIAAMMVPFAVMFAVIGMRVIGIAIEQVSIAAIIIALGLLVDNGVVLVEDITSRMDNGVPATQAAVAAGEQYAFPLLVSSVTTVAGFPATIFVVRSIR